MNYQIVIPHSLVNHGLELSHDSEIAAHSGVLRTLSSVLVYISFVLTKLEML